MSKFPKIHNGAPAVIWEGKVTFTYITSLGNVVHERKPILEVHQVMDKVRDRMMRFRKAGPGSRESEYSRAERKYVSAQSESLLRKVWDVLDDDEKMEMSMMLSEDSHFGISDPAWARKHAEKKDYIIGDDGEDLV